ncbi:TonB-dependent receptor plug domain-containing protein [Uliginosibacterium sp. H1]|uniref:TonB-dependent receptor plug domain-containing protein n=1 Tax=Uliginosibacterium sp. H1 TaxID=3114757 RepID=UPI002E18D679|nr:TonB-dependent receptor [Uliginosibacterium sp. H1]
MPSPSPVVSRPLAGTCLRRTAFAAALGGALSPWAALAAEPVQLAPVVVTATRSEKTVEDTPIRTEVVSREEIERTNARTLRDALENVPGLQLREVHGKSGYEISLQGLTSDQVLVLIDGLPVAASTGSTVDVGQYLLSEVERVEVVKGASSAQYGSAAMGGVVNIITRRIRPGLAAAATVDIGSYGDQNVSGRAFDIGSKHAQASVEGGNEQLRARLSADALQSDGFSTDPDSWPRQGDAVERQQYGGRLTWLPRRGSEFWIDASAYREDDEQRYLYFAPPNYIPQRKTESIERNRYAGGGQWRFDNGLRTEVKLLDERYDSNSQEFSNSFRTASRLSGQHINHAGLQVDLPAWYGQLWQFGADYHRETLTQTINGRSELDDTDAVRSSRELFAQNDYIINDTWELLLGLRWQDDSDFGTHLAPKLGLSMNLPAMGGWQGKLRASAGEGYRVPNLKERHYVFDHSSLGYMVMGNPELKPESSTSLQFGGSFRFRERLTVDLNLFQNRLKDLIQTDLDNYTVVNGIAVYSYRNVARARTRGVEAGARWQALDSLALNAAYTWTQAQDLDNGQDLTRRPRNMARLGLDWEATASTALTVRARYQSDELVSTATGARSPAWTTMDLALSHALGQGLSIFGGVNNLFDRQRDFTDGNDFSPLVGRYVYIGARYALDRTR